MARTGLLGAVFMLALTFSGLTAVPASAAGPEFTVLPSVKAYEETVGTGVFSAPGVGVEVRCGKGTATGEITGMRTFGKVVFKLKECTSSESGNGPCAIRSTNTTTEGEIVSTTLKGELGTVKASEATTEVGVLAEPASGKTWLTLAGNTCTQETKVTGQIAGEVGPIRTLTDKGFINFTTASTKQKIQKISVSSGLVEPKMTAFSANVIEEKFEHLESKDPMEID